jgi:regulator of sigma E protease
MDQLLAILLTAWDFSLVVVGFGLIIFIHELGHFVAARWAGIRVLAFALGFGPPLLTYRKGVGFTRQSSEGEYRRRHQSMMALAGRSVGSETDGVARLHESISPTEYRLNLLPLGGYVKMLGQEDLDPNATSDAADSYQQCVPWKRMIVISAGVVMNMILAAILFVVVFMVGMRVEPATIGDVATNSAAARASVTDSTGQPLDTPGLMPGDRVTAIEGRRPNSFSDLMLASAMAAPGRAVNLEIERPGVEGRLRASLTPQPNPVTNLLDFGIAPAMSTTIVSGRTEAENKEIEELLRRRGGDGLAPGMRLTRLVDSQGPLDIGEDDDSFAILMDRASRSEGRTFIAVFSGPVDDQARPSMMPGSAPLSMERTVSVSLTPEAELQTAFVPGTRGRDTATPVEHLLGLMPVMRVARANEPARAQGLRSGDIFVRIGEVEYPSFSQGIGVIRANAGGTVSMTILRRGSGEGTPEDLAQPEREVELPRVAVSAAGTVGFEAEGVLDRALVARPLATIFASAQDAVAGKQEAAIAPAAARLGLSPGTQITQVGDWPVASMIDVRTALTRIAAQAGISAQSASTAAPESLDVQITLMRPAGGRLGDDRTSERVTWTLSREDLRSVASLGWGPPRIAALFEPHRVILKASGPAEALSMGFDETRRVMLSTYVTFARLFQGTVKVEHLKGPVGIAHLGTLVAGKGFVWLLFFLAMISVNLAVINFLPLPIVDGGQFLFLLFEQLTGRPVPVAVQNVATMAGLLLIGSVFLIVTFNDLRNLLGF